MLHLVVATIIHNRDGRIVGHVPLALARTFWYTARLPAEKPMYKDDQKAKDCLYCSLCLYLPRQDKSPGKADRHIYEHKLRR